MTWHASTARWYSPSSPEAIDNATESMNILMTDFGWTFEACCGMFGNIDHEGAWNPWSWQGTGSPARGALTRAQARAEHGTNHGYGLIGWTPSGKYQFNNFATSGGTKYFPGYDQEHYSGYGPYFKNEENVALATDGAAQIRLIGEAMRRGSGNIWINRKGCTTSRFITLTDPRTAAYYWLWNAEYPANPQSKERQRMQSAQDWYERLGGGPQPLGDLMLLILKRAIDNQRGLQ